nr:hypothetical protein [Streptoalloteichus tenebrarius]
MERPSDRPAEAVLSALRQLDACALVDPSAAKSAGFARSVPEGPHTCDYLGNGGDKAEVRIGHHFDHGSRYRSEPIELGGVRAYLFRGEQKEKAPCELNIPVSFTLSIRLDVRRGESTSSDTCAQARALGGAAAARLATPDALKVDPATRPLSDWDGCTLARAATPQRPDLRVSTAIQDSVDECRLEEDKKDTKDTKQAGTFVWFKIRYTSDPLQGNHVKRQIGGRTAAVMDFGDNCWVSWAHGPSGNSDKLASHAVVEVKTQGCDNVANIAAEAMRVLAGAPPSPAAPQRPLTFRPDEPDGDAPGACVDFTSAGSSMGCEPHVAARVPTNKKDLMVAADKNPNVTCSMADEIVRQVFGQEMRPIVYGGHCYWGEPTHAVAVRVTLTPRYAPDQFGQDPSLYQNRQKKTFGGAPGVSWTASKGTQYEIYLSTTGDITKPGYLAGEVQAWPARGSADATADTSKLSRLDQVMTMLAERYLR